MKAKPHLIFLTTISLFMGLSIAAQTVHFDDPGYPDKATSITDLVVDSVTYNVDFVFDTPVNIYDEFPGTYTFTSESDALQAVYDISAALNDVDAPFIGPVDGGEFEGFSIGFEGVVGNPVNLCRFRTGGRPGTEWLDLGEDQISYLLDDRLFAVFTEVMSSVDNISFSQTKIYPNPANNSVNIISEMQDVELGIVNILGQTILKDKLNGNYELDVSLYEAGIYIIQFRRNDGSLIGERKLLVY